MECLPWVVPSLTLTRQAALSTVLAECLYPGTGRGSSVHMSSGCSEADARQSPQLSGRPTGSLCHLQWQCDTSWPPAALLPRIARHHAHHFQFVPPLISSISRSQMHEASMLMKLRHPNIVTFYGLWASKVGASHRPTHTQSLVSLHRAACAPKSPSLQRYACTRAYRTAAFSS